MNSVFPGNCTETVSILYALIFGAGDACVSISIWSLLAAFAAFMVAVIILQFLARLLWARLTTPPLPRDPDEHGAITDDPEYADSPIKSSRPM